jgi:hypothetical protein
MPRRCPNCGTYNSLGAQNCSRCQNSLEHIAHEEEKSLKDLKIFGIIFLVTAIVSISEYLYNLVSNPILGAGLGTGLASFFTGFSSSLSLSNISIYLLVVEILAVVILFIEAVSFIYLRSSFTKLRKFDFSFSTPATGMTLLVVGIIMAIIGLGVILAFIFPLLGSLSTTTTTPTTASLTALAAIVLGGLIGGIGGLLLLIGYIIGVLLGLHRLSTKFEESFFDYALVLIIVSLLFTPLLLVAAIFILMGIKRSNDRIKDTALEELMAAP